MKRLLPATTLLCSPFTNAATLRAALMGAAVIFAGSMFAPNAQADIVYSINTPNAALGGIGYTGPYVNVGVHLNDATHAVITFTSLSDPTNTVLYLMGDGSSAAVSVNATSWNVTDIGALNQGCTAAFTDCQLSNGGVGNVSDFGTMQQITSFDGFGTSGPSSVITFGLTNTQMGGSWAESTVLKANSDGFLAAAHIFPCVLTSETGCTQANGVLTATGFAAVPAPIVGAGLPGLMLAALGMVGLARRRKKLASV